MSGSVSRGDFAAREENLILTSFKGIVCRLRRIQSSRYEIGLQMQGHVATDLTYTSLVCAVYVRMNLPAPC